MKNTFAATPVVRRHASSVLLSIGALVLSPLAAAAAPQIASVTPSSGATPGGYLLTISGTGFSTAGNAVTVDGSSCSLSTEQDDRFICTAPEGAGTVNDVVLTDALGESSNAANFTYDAPSLSSITPSSAPTNGGAVLTLTGSNFGPGFSARTVTLAPTGGSCTVSPASNTHFETLCTLPEGQGGPFDVSIIIDGQSSNSQPFSYDAPAISSVTPDNGRASGNTPLTIYGSSFGTDATASVSGSDCPVTAQTHSQLECTSPAGTAGPAGVFVSVAGHTSNSAAFEYNPPPSILSITPTHASAAGFTPLTINGQSFKKGSLPSTATVGGRLCTLTFEGETELLCTLPEGSGADRVVRVITDEQASNTVLFDYDAPSISSVTPSSGPTAGSILLTISGLSFGTSSTDPLQSVTVGTSACPPETSTGDHQSLRCTLPPGQGMGNTVVVTLDGQASPPASFDYDAPTISGITPAYLPTTGSVPLTIAGSNFGLSASVSVGGAPCPITSQAHTQLVCTLPAGTGSSVAVNVIVSGQIGSSTLDYSAVVCGDGNTAPGEVCDDGDNDNGDGCSSDCVIEQTQDKDQAGCIVAMNKAGAKIDKMQAKAIEACAKNAAAGVACVGVTTPALDAAMAKSDAAFDKKCASPPDFGTALIAVIKGSSRDRLVDQTIDLFGADPDAVLVPDAMNPARSLCQQSALRALHKLASAELKTFIKCKKTELKAETVRTSGQLRDACLGFFDEESSVFKAKQALSDALTNDCITPGVAAEALPGVCASAPDLAGCASKRVRCGSCLTVARMDELDADCDEFDDALPNASCPAP